MTADDCGRPLLTLGLAAVVVIVWLVRVEGRVNAQSEASKAETVRLDKEIPAANARVEADSRAHRGTSDALIRLEQAVQHLTRLFRAALRLDGGLHGPSASRVRGRGMTRDQLKALVCNLAHPFAIIVTSLATSVATFIVALCLSDGNDCAAFMGAVVLMVGGVYGYKAVETWKTKIAPPAQ